MALGKIWKKVEDTVKDVGSTAQDIYGDVEDAAKDIYGDITGQVDNTNVNVAVFRPRISQGPPRGWQNIVENLESAIEDNNDSLADLESGINTTVSDTVDNLETNVEGAASLADSGVSIVNWTGDVVHQGLDASVNTNNPQSAITNPVKWWELNTQGAAEGDWFFSGDDATDTMAGKGADVLGDAFEPMYDWLGEGVSTVSDTFVGIGESLGNQLLNQRSKQGLQGDPFGMEGPRRRDILEQKTFKDRGGAIAPSRINQGGYA
jgi:hypothetical protein